jgi:plasmid stability protein
MGRPTYPLEILTLSRKERVCRPSTTRGSNRRKAPPGRIRLSRRARVFLTDGIDHYSLIKKRKRANQQLGCFASVASSDSIDSMATLTIRQLDEKTKTRLRVRAAHHGRSMEEEAREILRLALTASSPVKGNLAETIHRRFAPFGGLEFELPRRDAMRAVPGFGE